MGQLGGRGRGFGGADPETYRRFGVEPAQAQIIVVKMYFNFQGLQSLMKGSVMADWPGLATGEYFDNWLSRTIIDEFGDNSPAVMHIRHVAGDSLSIAFLAKGGGAILAEAYGKEID